MTLKEKLDSDRFIVCGEVGPPQSCNGEVIRRKAQFFKSVVDAVNITDNQTAMPRLSSIAAAKILLDEGIEPIMQITCRDRNRLAMQSDLLGAAALGIHNVLCLTGDYQKFGSDPEAKGVYDLDSIQLIAMVAKLNSGYLLSGQKMKTAPNFLIGAAANPFAVPLEMRLIRLYKKIQAGAHFVQTQPVFDLELFRRWMEKVVEMGLHQKVAILAGVMPVKSVNTLTCMQADVPGVKINEEYIQRMEKATDPKTEGVKIAAEIIQAIRKITGVHGIHIMPVFWESIIPTVVKEAGLRN